MRGYPWPSLRVALERHEAALARGVHLRDEGLLAELRAMGAHRTHGSLHVARAVGDLAAPFVSGRAEAAGPALTRASDDERRQSGNSGDPHEACLSAFSITWPSRRSRRAYSASENLGKLWLINARRSAGSCAMLRGSGVSWACACASGATAPAVAATFRARPFRIPRDPWRLLFAA